MSKKRVPTLQLRPRGALDDAKWRTQLHQTVRYIQPGQRIELDLAVIDETPTTKSNNQPIDQLSSLNLPRFGITIVDNSQSKLNQPKCQCGVIILPQGRESEYMFAHPEGQQSLMQQHSFDRLIFVTLNRGHTFTQSLKEIQHELNQSVKFLLPEAAPSGVPYLAVSDDVGERQAVSVAPSVINQSKHQSVSRDNGDLIVEDVRVGECWYRRLVFSHSGYPQSEARMKRKAKGKKARIVDHGFVPATYQQTILCALSLITRPLKQICMIGLGGGQVPMFLSLAQPQIEMIEVVEIDQGVIDQATSYFDFKQHEKLQCHLEDGLKFVKASTNQYDCLIVDCNSVDLSEGLSFPPADFLSLECLADCHNRLREGGALIINFGCRGSKLRNQLIQRIHQALCVDHAGLMYELQVDEEDVNTILAIIKQSHNQSSHESILPVTACQMKQRILIPDRVKASRTAHAECMTEVQGKQFDMDKQMKLQDRIESVQRITGIVEGVVQYAPIEPCMHDDKCQSLVVNVDKT